MSVDPKSFNTPDAAFLAPSDVDNVGRAVLLLAMELAVVSDRLIALEDLVENQCGIDPHAVLAARAPGDAAQQRMERERERLVRLVIETLARP